MKFVFAIFLLAVFCIAATPDERQKDKEAKQKSLIEKLKKQKALPQPGLDPPKASNNYLTLRNLIKEKSYSVGTLHIVAIWGKGKKNRILSKLKIPFPLEMRRDKTTGELRIKVKDYLTSRPGLNESWKSGAKKDVKGSQWPSLRILNLGLGKDFELTSSQIVPPSVAPTVSPTTAPPTVPLPYCIRVVPGPGGNYAALPSCNAPPCCKYPPCCSNNGPFNALNCVSDQCDSTIGPQPCHCSDPNASDSCRTSYLCVYGGHGPRGLNRSVVPTVTTDIPFVSSANFLVIGVASVMPFFLTFF